MDTASNQILIHLLSYYSIGVDGIGMDTGSNVQYPAIQETRGTSHSCTCGIICEMFFQNMLFFIICLFYVTLHDHSTTHTFTYIQFYRSA